MNLEQIKHEIIKKLTQLRKDSKKFTDTKNYNELQQIITKSIVAVTECDTAQELENIDVYLESIEFYYNSCVEESTGEPSEEELFDFNFELEEENEEEEIVSKKKDNNLKSLITEIEDFYDSTLTRCSKNSQRKSLKSLKEEALDSVRQASSELELLNATRNFRRAFKEFTAKLSKSEANAQAKLQFDEKITKKNSKKMNILRMLLAFAALIGGAIYGFILDWTTLPEWPMAIMGFGVSCLLLCIIYVMADSAKKSTAKRRLAFARLILAALFLTASIVIAIVFSKYIGMLASLTATLPFTVGGVFAYVIYRLKLKHVAKKIPTKKK